ncbi:exopolyphosphatase [Veillonella denticariosi JCM 15641]|uniref:Exopolyphosphatase n=1 Tax=Veillonella denticariosi JCM 15641 TaxID=1298594 RepID=A0A2S7Z6D4_9FIRM|nr:Ppx/GppA phosphatase family protein [Veillonella denticariosi]PQL18844.1 exopolyphosphatase [Veillonella denticariosi JCM 15641]
MKRIAFIDLGSNSVRFVIYEISDTGSYRLIYQEKESVRLSENMWGTHELTPAAMERSLESLKAFVHMAEAMGVDTIKAVATAAVRLAKNGDTFIKIVKDETGLDLECIAGEEEARLGFLGVINTIGLKDFIVFDLGGASTEITLVRNRRIVKAVSLPIGALTLTGTYQKGDEYTSKELDKMSKAIKKIIKEHAWLRNIKLPLLGIGGTARNIAKMDQRKLSYPITKLHNYEIPYHRFYEILQEVVSKPLAERKKINGLSTDRADIIIAGMTIVDELFNYVNTKTLVVGGCGLREGLFYDYYGQHYLGGNPIIEDILVHSAENVLLGMTKHEFVHANYICGLAMKLYDMLQPLHRADRNVRRCLMVASLLHDIGKRVNYYSHARHGCYMLVNSNLYGITHIEQAFSAFLVMNSHGLTPKEYKNFLYGKLLDQEQRLLGQKLSIILALAEALDESHEQFIKSLDVTIDKNSVQLLVTYAKGKNISVTKSAVEKLVKAFKKEYKHQLHIEWTEAR